MSGAHINILSIELGGFLIFSGRLLYHHPRKFKAIYKSRDGVEQFKNFRVE